MQVCTDNAANCKAAGALVMERFPQITWSPCAAHVCDLAFEDIFKMEPFQSMLADTKEYVTFIRQVCWQSAHVQQTGLAVRSCTTKRGAIVIQ
jgi:hypothetical protein